MAVITVPAAPAWTQIGTGPLSFSVRQAPVEVFFGSAPGANDQGITFPTGENYHLPAPASAVYARPLAAAKQAVVISFTAGS